jgi:hypothetical protein
MDAGAGHWFVDASNTPQARIYRVPSVGKVRYVCMRTHPGASSFILDSFFGLGVWQSVSLALPACPSCSSTFLMMDDGGVTVFSWTLVP